MKYKKATTTIPLSEMVQCKATLHDFEDFKETPWVARAKDEYGAYLLNHAVCFAPNYSWGAYVPVNDAGTLNFVNMLEKQELILHPEAWDAYIEQGIMDKDGNAIEGLPGPYPLKDTTT